MAEETEGTTFNLDFTRISQEARSAGGHVFETDRHVVVHIPGRDRLVVGFDNLASVMDEGPRIPWAYDLIRSQGWGCLGVMIKERDWFRSDALYDHLEGLRDGGLCGLPLCTLGAGLHGGGLCAAIVVVAGRCPVRAALSQRPSAL